ncbi:alpha/beta hydrolase [Sinomonas terrae]|uniref:Alpha/beta hydrolase n=1 Tax=Sinomonas terrae TaxID=2908838 RepID=A0ABS9U2T0_9MICC|nr:alpha/beta hydrolase [Sinomonas terrae]MCH6470712.1 alpha/beta hydrolase [Sinomonas terrae]
MPIAGAEDAQFAGFFYPAEGDRRGVLQVLAHGNTYDHRYWDAPSINGREYSYVRFMTKRGFDVVALDLPGVGESDKPESGAFTVESVGQALSSLIDSFRRPTSILGRRFTQIISIGHSLGSMVGVFAEANWPAADLLVVTGTGYFPLRPRNKWAPGERESLLVNPYALVPPQSRLKYYHQPKADPAVITYDNQNLRTSMPSRLWDDTIHLSNNPDAAGVHDVRCPVYIQLGEYDPTLPARYSEQERECYRSSIEVSVDPLHDMGHCFNLHLNRELSWNALIRRLSQ